MKNRLYNLLISTVAGILTGITLVTLVGVVAHCEDIPSMIRKEALRQGLDPDIAVSIATIESNLNIHAIGPKKEIGLFQILPRYSPVPRKQLFDPKINIRIGIMKLIEARDRCPVQENLSWTICYNNGWRHPKYPFLHPYYIRFMRVWANL